jgi:TIR domain
MSDFFVSYTKADEQWAEWISWVLEEAGFSVTLQAWDFAAGGNFVLEMQRAASEAPRTIAVLSPDYLDSRYAAPEWAAAFAADPEGLKRRLIPVRVHECRPQGLWRAIIHIDLVGLDEANAQQRLLSQLAGKRSKPIERPAFPGSGGSKPPPFPGANRPAASQGPTPYMPKIRAAHSDLDKRRFLREAFSVVAQHFERGLAVLGETHGPIDVNFNPDGTSKFTAEIFVNGKSQARCKVWIANQFGEGIAYYEGHDTGGSNTLNEMLVVSESENELVFNAQMGSLAFGRIGEGLDLHHLTSTTGAEYLWRRLVSHLE